MNAKPRIRVVAIALVSWLLVLAGACPAQDKPWAFAVVTDPEPHTPRGDKNARAPFTDDLIYLKETFVTKATADRPAPELVVVPGDVAPFDVTAKAFRDVLGDGLPWLPVPGNHDQSAEESKKMSGLLGGYEKLALRWGPMGPTGLQYSFTRHNILFVGLNIYWNGKKTPGSEIAASGLGAEGLQWAQETLSGSDARYKIVYGHRPAWPFGGRHDKEPLAESTDLRDRFWKTLADHGCQLYLCGHTHSYGAYRWLGNEDPNRWQGHTSKIIPEALGLWQVNAGSVRGEGSAYDRTVLYFRVTDKAIQVETHIWRKADGAKGKYELPPNTDTELYQFEIYPDLKDNLKAQPKSPAGK